MATGEADTFDSETVRSELMAMYQARAGQGFLQSLLDAASDPVRPVDQAKRRRFHPLLVMLFVVAAIVAAAFVYFTLKSR
jgi:phosphotransferase system  glucose/maltose/N-acetylglucosamine-specific IIC component